MKLLSVVLMVACCWQLTNAGVRRLRRSTAGEAASSYFYFSRTPGHVFPAEASPFSGAPSGLPVIPETKAFFPAKVLKSVSEFGADTVEEFGKGLSSSDESDDHDAYRVVEDKDDEEEVAGGSSYEVGHHAHKDSRGEQGYDKKHTLEQVNRGSHGKEAHQHRYAQDGSRKKSHHDEGSHYHDHHQEAKRTKGGKHHEKKHHKKGSKTTGYHNVYHKDEYKKEHVFYDTSDHTGQFKKYGSAHEHHSNEAGKHGAGGHEDRAHQEASYQKKGSKDQGAYDEHHDQHLHRHGNEKHNQSGSHYEQKHGHAGAGESGYKIFHH
ncbi:AGAP006214-PA-like protein [Anopheles sinensis]|uniref:AGAP006214-PA-like protein n=1 Tax=Anopheles sinensis TaxID=74873 RepID=A0A084WK35_ANOSI|nr:AGAP006214-PA-like protein [Anopheles sinensis]